LWTLIRYLPAEAAVWQAYKPPQPVEKDPNAIASFFKV
jgi:hypothetical protein